MDIQNSSIFNLINEAYGGKDEAYRSFPPVPFNFESSFVSFN